MKMAFAQAASLKDGSRSMMRILTPYSLSSPSGASESGSRRARLGLPVRGRPTLLLSTTRLGPPQDALDPPHQALASSTRAQRLARKPPRLSTSPAPSPHLEPAPPTMSYNPHTSSSNLLGSLEGNITADDESAAEEGRARSSNASHQQQQPLLPTYSTSATAPPEQRGSVNVTNGISSTDAQGDSIWSQSAHPVALFFLYAFRCAAIATYLLCGFFVSSYVFSVRPSLSLELAQESRADMARSPARRRSSSSSSSRSTSGRCATCRVGSSSACGSGTRSTTTGRRSGCLRAAACVPLSLLVCSTGAFSSS